MSTSTTTMNTGEKGLLYLVAAGLLAGLAYGLYLILQPDDEEKKKETTPPGTQAPDGGGGDGGGGDDGGGDGGGGDDGGGEVGPETSQDIPEDKWYTEGTGFFWCMMVGLYYLILLPGIAFLLEYSTRTGGAAGRARRVSGSKKFYGTVFALAAGGGAVGFYMFFRSWVLSKPEELEVPDVTLPPPPVEGPPGPFPTRTVIYWLTVAAVLGACFATAYVGFSMYTTSGIWFFISLILGLFSYIMYRFAKDEDLINKAGMTESYQVYAVLAALVGSISLLVPIANVLSGRERRRLLEELDLVPPGENSVGPDEGFKNAKDFKESVTRDGKTQREAENLVAQRAEVISRLPFSKAINADRRAIAAKLKEAGIKSGSVLNKFKSDKKYVNDLAKKVATAVRKDAERGRQLSDEIGPLLNQGGKRFRTLQEHYLEAGTVKIKRE